MRTVIKGTLIAAVFVLAGVYFLRSGTSPESSPPPFDQLTSIQAAPQSGATQDAPEVSTTPVAADSNSLPTPARDQDGVTSLMSERQRLLEHAQLLSESKSAPNAQGQITETQVWHTSFKYPLIRTVDTQFNGKSLNKEFMVGDHLNIVRPERISAEKFERLVLDLGATIRKQTSDPRHYLVAFEARTPEALDEWRKKFAQALGADAIVDPDFIRFHR